MAISENKMQIVIDNYFKSECDINTSIRSAFEKGFRIGVKKASPAQQENDWTPVSKKKHPDKEGEYLVTDDAGGMATVDKDVFMFLDDGTPCWLYSQNVTAWRELPEPYEERREG